jgi:nucleoside-diphosphate-sugar epimerase
MACYLVTGGAGFIGSHIAEALLRRGDKVRILDNFSTGHRENLAVVPGAEVVEGDIRSYHIVRAVVEGVDVDVNVTGTLNVLAASRDARVSRLVFASSSSVYGTNPELPKRESMLPSPLSPYAVSKLAGESYCRAFTQIYDFETVVLRYFNVFGPRQGANSAYAAVIPRFIDALLNKRSPVIYGDGSQTRDFTYVQNVVEANLTACDRQGVAGRTFNIAGGRSISLLQLLGDMAAIVGTGVEPVFQAARTGDVPHSLADISAARSGLGYDPRVEVREGLERTVQFAIGPEAASRRTAA